MNFMGGNSTMAYARPDTGKTLILVMSKLSCLLK